MTGHILQRAALRAARRFSAAAIIAAALACLAAAPIAAHGEQILQLGAERIQPGGTVEVRGDLGSGESFEVALISKADGSRRLIATIPAVDEGHFQSFVTIPADVAVGGYLLEVAVDLSVIRAPLEVAGSPIGAEGGGGPEQEEGLIVPLPSTFGRASPGVPLAAGVGASTGPSDATATSTRSGRSPADGAIVVGVAVTVAVGLLVALRLVRRRRSTGGPAGS